MLSYLQKYGEADTPTAFTDDYTGAPPGRVFYISPKRTSDTEFIRQRRKGDNILSFFSLFSPNLSYPSFIKTRPKL